MEKIKLLIADDDIEYRQLVSSILGRRDEYEIVAEAKNGNEALAFTKAFLPDIVLLDIRMPGMDGIIATRIIKDLYHPQVKVIGVSITDDEDLIDEMMEAGASGFIVKSDLVGVLFNAVKAVFGGQYYYQNDSMRDMDIDEI